MALTYLTYSILDACAGWLLWGQQDQFAPLRLSACSWFGEVTFIGTSLKRETRRFLPFAGPLSRSFFHA